MHTVRPDDQPSWLVRVLSQGPIQILLVLVILLSIGMMFHACLLEWGEHLWAGYAELRIDPPGRSSLKAGPGGSEEGVESEEDDLFRDLFGEEILDPAAQEAAAAARLEQERLARERESRLTIPLRCYSVVETRVEALLAAGVNFLPQALVLLLLLGGCCATAGRSHIALREIADRTDDRISHLCQLVANGMIAVSAWAKLGVSHGMDAQIQWIWIGGMGGMSFICLIHLLWPIQPPSTSAASKGLSVSVLSTIPLYTYMAIISGAYFFLVEHHVQGLAIYLKKLTQHAILYLQVGLYIWTGMLLKQTLLGRLSFDIVRPWRFPPELLAVIVVVAAALPTAYSGASGIFVIAMGATIFQELRRAGTSVQRALSATAMSGSLGVVLNPCLLVVIVASLNKQVTTDQLYGWGWKVFLLTSFLFLFASWLTRAGPWRIRLSGEAVGQSWRAVRDLVPYVLIGAAMLFFFSLVLDVRLNEHNSPILLPCLLLLLLPYDRRLARRREDGPGGAFSTFRAATAASRDAGVHIGALLILMSLSVCLGGVIERAELVSIFPTSLDSTLLTMIMITMTLVVIGMIMDPYGAVILVSVTLAPVAYQNQIHPVHFWMVVLVAFELGYLTPPVALNHLLARQVVGPLREDEATPSGRRSFWIRHERILLPVSVMSTALFLVAFVPLFFY